MKRTHVAEAVRTGWPAGLLQDDSRELSAWLANRPGARRQVREVVDGMARPTPLVGTLSRGGRAGNSTLDVSLVAGISNRLTLDEGSEGERIVVDGLGKSAAFWLCATAAAALDAGQTLRLDDGSTLRKVRRASEGRA